VITLYRDSHQTLNIFYKATVPEDAEPKVSTEKTFNPDDEKGWNKKDPLMPISEAASVKFYNIKKILKEKKENFAYDHYEVLEKMYKVYLNPETSHYDPELIDIYDHRPH
jgi:hypothetical protein